MSQAIAILPTLGLNIVRLGDAPHEAKAALLDQQLGCDYHEPTLTLYCEALKAQLQFSSGDSPQLFQVILEEHQVTVDGRLIVGQRLDEVLLNLQVATFSDTLWSYVDVDSEYVGGVLIDDAKRPRKCKSESLIAEGTLWIKSLGLGLSLRHGVVEAVCIRRAEDVPTVGCGELQRDELQQIISPVLFPSIEHFPTPRVIIPRVRLGRPVRAFLALLAVAFVALPAWVVYHDIMAWKSSIAVTGTVIETRPEGPFPDEIVVNYTTHDKQSRQVVISSNYTTARELGETVELLYRVAHPDRAMTRVQIRDDGLSISPYYLFASVAVATFCLVGAFPKHIRLRSR